MANMPSTVMRRSRFHGLIRKCHMHTNQATRPMAVSPVRPTFMYIGTSDGPIGVCLKFGPVTHRPMTQASTTRASTPTEARIFTGLNVFSLTEVWRMAGPSADRRSSVTVMLFSLVWVRGAGLGSRHGQVGVDEFVETVGQDAVVGLWADHGRPGGVPDRDAGGDQAGGGDQYPGRRHLSQAAGLEPPDGSAEADERAMPRSTSASSDTTFTSMSAGGKSSSMATIRCR